MRILTYAAMVTWYARLVRGQLAVEMNRTMSFSTYAAKVSPYASLAQVQVAVDEKRMIPASTHAALATDWYTAEGVKPDTLYPCCQTVDKLRYAPTKRSNIFVQLRVCPTQNVRWLNGQTMSE